MTRFGEKKMAHATLDEKLDDDTRRRQASAQEKFERLTAKRGARELVERGHGAGAGVRGFSQSVF